MLKLVANLKIWNLQLMRINYSSDTFLTLKLPGKTQDLTTSDPEHLAAPQE